VEDRYEAFYTGGKVQVSGYARSCYLSMYPKIYMSMSCHSLSRAVVVYIATTIIIYDSHKIIEEFLVVTSENNHNFISVAYKWK